MIKKLTLAFFIVSYYMFTTGLVVNMTVLNKNIYYKVLDENHYYKKAYVTLLSNQNLESGFNSLVQDSALSPYSEGIYSILSSTLYFFFPETKAEPAVKMAIDYTLQFMGGSKSINPSFQRPFIQKIYDFGENLMLQNETTKTILSLRSLLTTLSTQVFYFGVIFTILMLSSYIYLQRKNLYTGIKNIALSLAITSAVLVFEFMYIFNAIDKRLMTFGENFISIFLRQVVEKSAHVAVLYLLTIILISLMFVLYKPLLNFLKNKKNLTNVGIVLGVVILILMAFALLKPIKCNGYKQLCDRPVNEVVFASTHNSMSISDYGWLWPSHDGTVTDQLNYGIRGFLIDTHYYDAVDSLSGYFPNANKVEVAAAQALFDKIGVEKKDGLFLCHIVCQLGSTPLENTLEEYKDFLKKNRHEVIVLIIEDNISTQDTLKAFEDAGLTKYTYQYNGGAWPTMRELIRKNKRLIVMGENTKTNYWYMSAWENTMDTPYDFKNFDEISSKESCMVNRGGENKSFFLMNNWIERVSPSRTDAERVNNYEFLYNRAKTCETLRGKLPNFIAVNFFYNGDVVKVVNRLNGVSD